MDQFSEKPEFPRQWLCAK